MRVQLDAFFNLELEDGLARRTDVPAIILAKAFEYGMQIDVTAVLGMFNPRLTMKIDTVKITKIGVGVEQWEHGEVHYWIAETETEFYIKEHRYILKRTSHWYLSEGALSGGTTAYELYNGQTGEKLL